MADFDPFKNPFEAEQVLRHIIASRFGEKIEFELFNGFFSKFNLNFILNIASQFFLL